VENEKAVENEKITVSELTIDVTYRRLRRATTPTEDRLSIVVGANSPEELEEFSSMLKALFGDDLVVGPMLSTEGMNLDGETS
jgi:hypothetical protein